MLRATALIFLCLSYSLCSLGQQKSVQAAKIKTAPRIDGILDDEEWSSAPAAGTFITSSPSFGLPATDSTCVKVLYDNTAIYIGAYLYGNPAHIRRQFTPRDQERHADVDYFSVFIDSYKDRQNAFQFLVTSRNVQSDARISPAVIPEDGVFGDLSWDAVWDSKVSMRPDGW